MSHDVPAIYENGVLKPLEPLSLAEHQRVWISIAPEVPAAIDDAESASKQRQAMEELDAIMDQLPDLSPDDGFVAADHDKLLYGDPA